MGGGVGVGVMPEASHPHQPLVKPPSKSLISLREARSGLKMGLVAR